MVFVAIVIPAIVQGLTLANRAGAVAERQRLAVQLADRLLSELIVTNSWRTSESEGDFGESWPGFRWTLTDQPWSEDDMVELSVEVFFEVQGREHSVYLTTLVEEETQQ